jgi:threonine/homoserine/homoserine lactone efflux protein
MQVLPAFILAGFALAGSPGPATLSLAAAAAAFGARRALGYLFGLVAGIVLVMLITATGVTGVLLALPGATPVVIALAGIYFAYLAFRIATAPPLTDDAARRRQPTFAAGVFLSLVNPKGYAAMAALFSGFVLLPGRVGIDAALKVLVITVIVVIVNFAWLLAGAALTRAFREPRANRVINVVFALLLVVSVVATLPL